MSIIYMLIGYLLGSIFGGVGVASLIFLVWVIRFAFQTLIEELIGRDFKR